MFLFYLHLIYVTIGMHLCSICNRRTTNVRYDNDIASSYSALCTRRAKNVISFNKCYKISLHRSQCRSAYKSAKLVQSRFVSRLYSRVSFYMRRCCRGCWLHGFRVLFAAVRQSWPCPGTVKRRAIDCEWELLEELH